MHSIRIGGLATYPSRCAPSWRTFVLVTLRLLVLRPFRRAVPSKSVIGILLGLCCTSTFAGGAEPTTWRPIAPGTEIPLWPTTPSKTEGQRASATDVLAAGAGRPRRRRPQLARLLRRVNQGQGSGRVSRLCTRRPCPRPQADAVADHELAGIGRNLDAYRRNIAIFKMR